MTNSCAVLSGCLLAAGRAEEAGRAALDARITAAEVGAHVPVCVRLSLELPKLDADVSTKARNIARGSGAIIDDRASEGVMPPAQYTQFGPALRSMFAGPDASAAADKCALMALHSAMSEAEGLMVSLLGQDARHILCLVEARTHALGATGDHTDSAAARTGLVGISGDGKDSDCVYALWTHSTCSTPASCASRTVRCSARNISRSRRRMC